MLKKVISIIIVLCVVISISVMAENENMAIENSAPEISEQNPQNPGEPPQGGRGNMGMPPSGDMQGRTQPTMPNGEMPPEGMNRGQRPSGDFVPPENSGEFTPPQSEFPSPQNNVVNNNTEATTPQTAGDTFEENSPIPGGNQQFGGQMPGGMGGFFGNMQNFNEQNQEEQPKGFWGFAKTYSTPITSVVLLGLAFIFVIFYRRKNY